MINSFVPIFEKYFQQLNQQLEIHITNGDTFNLNNYVIQTSMKVIYETNFGGKEIDSELTYELFDEYLESVARRLFTPPLHIDSIYRWSSNYTKDSFYLKRFFEIFTRIAKERLDSTKLDSNGNHKLFIDELLKHISGDPIDNNPVLVHNLATVFMAGYDTTAVTISNVCLMLAMHPEVDKRLEEELFENYREGDVIDGDLLKRFTYLEQVIKETMRLYPSAPFAARSNIKDVTLGKQ